MAMEVILLEKIQNTGDIGDLVTVKNGYARNYLIPQKKAMLATEEAKEKVEERKRQLAAEEAKRLDGAKARADLAVREISLVRLCSEEGHLYGSVAPTDIAEAMTRDEIVIEKSEITQPDGPIKIIGDFEADVILHPEVRFTVAIHVTGELPDGSNIEASELVVESEAESQEDAGEEGAEPAQDDQAEAQDDT